MPPNPGWQVFPHEPELEAWLRHVRPHAEAAVDQNGQWLRHDGTWFAGVDVLCNDVAGRVAGGPPLACEALEVAGRVPLHKGQVSVTYPGYPGRDPQETDAAHRYRRDRDAAHLDGLLPIGTARRRMIREPHAWILGLPVSPMRRDNAPLVVYEGSHEILRSALIAALRPHPIEAWADVDITDAYQAARRRCFEACRRVEIEAMPGEAILLHRLTLHGVAPWTGPAGPARSVLYFRPVLPGGILDWLALP
ncbi:MAG: hypothetical protein AAGF88_09850 [Pseudomonadota bacterium]